MLRIALPLRSFLAANPDATISMGASSNNQIATPATPVLVGDNSRAPAADFGVKPDLPPAWMEPILRNPRPSAHQHCLLRSKGTDRR
jgi:hypothetical protein